MTPVNLANPTGDLGAALLHQVAVTAGCYLEENLDVRLLSLDVQDPASFDFRVDVAAALMERLRGGSPWSSIVVASDYPLLWLFTGGEINNLEGLQSKPICCPDAQVIQDMTWAALSSRGLKRMSEVEWLPIPVGVDGERQALGLLQAGDVAAAVTGGWLPPVLWFRAGFRLSLAIGETIRVSTFGLAANASRLELDGDRVLRMGRAVLRALAHLQEEDTVRTALTLLGFDDGEDQALATWRRFIQPYLLQDGIPFPERCMDGLRELAAAGGGVKRIPPFTELYRTELTLHALP